MTGKSVLLDSTVLIDALNGVAPARSFLHEVGDTACVSAITRAEVLAGYDSARRPRVAQLLDRFRFLPITRDVADIAGSLRRDHSWRLPDAMQAAAAQVHGLDLATRNTRDFPAQRHDFVVVPYTL